MFCGNCGAKLTKSSVFCGECGAKVNSGGGRPELNIKPFRVGVKPPMKLVVAAAVIIIIAAAAFIIVRGSGRSYVYTVMQNTQKAYQKEIDSFTDGNPVVNTLITNLTQSNTQKIEISGFGRIDVRDDKTNQIFQVNTVFSELPVSANTYVTNDAVIFGYDGVLYLDANPQAFGTDLVSALDNLGLGLLGFTGVDVNIIKKLVKQLDTFDFSYNGIQKFNAFNQSDDIAEVMKLISGQMRNFTKRADYKKQNSTVQLGDKTVKTKQIILTADADVLEGWLTEDVMPALKESDALRNYWNGLNGANALRNEYDGSYYESTDYDKMLTLAEFAIPKFIEEMRNVNGEIVINIQVYKGVAVSIEVLARNGSAGEEVSFMLSALGEKYRLNDIRFNFFDGSDSYEISASGNHFSKTAFTSAVRLRAPDINEELTIEWDLQETNNNLRIGCAGELFSMALLADGGVVTAKFAPYFTWSVESLDSPVILPEKTKKLRDVTIFDMGEEIWELINKLYEFYSAERGAV